MKLDRLDLGPPHNVTLGYTEWGRPHSPQTILCVHGLTRNARDFDFLAEALAEKGARVIAIDMVGRGTSSWLADPMG
jgi:pimeloyl-ACP methyl ester carboxylesterase